VKASQALVSGKTEKLSSYARVMYGLLEDVLALHCGAEQIRNEDLRERLERLARRVDFEWVRQAAGLVDEWDGLEKRNVQKAAAADYFVTRLADSAQAAR
jgi:hypothetical protein